MRSFSSDSVPVRDTYWVLAQCLGPREQTVLRPGLGAGAPGLSPPRGGESHLWTLVSHGRSSWSRLAPGSFLPHMPFTGTPSAPHQTDGALTTPAPSEVPGWPQPSSRRDTQKERTLTTGQQTLHGAGEGSRSFQQHLRDLPELSCDRSLGKRLDENLHKQGFLWRKKEKLRM